VSFFVTKVQASSDMDTFWNTRTISFAAVGVLAVAGATAWFLAGDDKAAALATDLQQGDAGERYHAAKELEDLGTDAAAAVDELAAALDDSSEKVRYRAAKALSKIGPDAAPAVPALARSLQDEERDVRYYAAKSLYTIGRQSREALPELVDALDDPDDEVRYYTIKALGEFGADARSAAGALQRFARGSNSKIQEAAQSALEKISE
jgi:hypothetical protein